MEMEEHKYSCDCPGCVASIRGELEEALRNARDMLMSYYISHHMYKIGEQTTYNKVVNEANNVLIKCLYK